MNGKQQRIPVISFASLVNPNLDEAKKRNPHLIVLNPIPNAVRKGFFGLLTFGAVNQKQVTNKVEYHAAPNSIDRRYVEAVVKIGQQQFIIPKLIALSVAFSYL